MKKRFMLYALGAMLLAGLCLSGCSQIALQTVKIDEEYHQGVLSVAKTRIKYVSCDIGLIDGLGVTSSVSFPIKTSEEARALLANPAIGLALTEMREMAEKTLDENGKPYWNQNDYNMCKVVGLGYRATALSVVDVLKLFPQLAPYLSTLGL